MSTPKYTPHHHIAKGSMKDAHNLDDRKERALLATDDHIEALPAEEIKKSADRIAQRFSNLGWLNNRSPKA